ncbi:hypothetical protein [Kordia sp.]|uniref:hypothetical protein n=1 Tax=Kordia sp. TaxID=1965332 RepID=UPI003D6B4140
MKKSRRNLGKLTLSKLMIAQIGEPAKISGGSAPEVSKYCDSRDVCTLICGSDTIDTQ